MPHDGQRARTYAAEWRWRSEWDRTKSVRTLGQAEALLRRILPPGVTDRLDVVPLTKLNTTDGGWVDYHGHGRYRVAFRTPTHPSIVVHEGAHVLTHLCDQRDVHGPEYRANLLWLTRLAFGVRAARYLAACFEKEGLDAHHP